MKFSIDKKQQYGTIFKYNFYNLTDLYNYLISDPKVNRRIFESRASLDRGVSFAGEDLPTAIEYLKGGYKFNLNKFNISINDLRKLGYQDTDSRKLERCIHGGAYLSPLVAASVPDCMVRYTKDTELKQVTIYFQLAYPHFTNAEQIFNRGVATINLIQALEEKGYIVDLKVFELSRCGDEYLDITVNLKKTDEYLNISRCYYPFVGKEFLRRLLFRVLESAPVNEFWSNGYGRALDASQIRKFYKLREKDLVIPGPTDLGVDGKDIYEDTINFFNALNLQEEFDLSKFKQKIKSKKHSLY